jgi:hypothetical protein
VNSRFDRGVRRAAYLGFCLLFLTTVHAPARPATVSKWARFEASFRSSVAYTNPLQQCELKVAFVSPLGETNEIYGFWDGGRTWRVRFMPDVPGRWSYVTSCSDHGNRTLNGQKGAFLCTVPTGDNRFQKHGPVQVARDGRHFQHADGKPFFWIADCAWNGARLSSDKDWQVYATVRSSQKFTASQWAVTPGADAKGLSAFVVTDATAVNPEYFKHLDAKIETLNRSGLLSVIAPFWEGNGGNLSTEQSIRFLRYLAARWGANDVAWIIAPPLGASAEAGVITRWKEIGHSVFAGRREDHAPVIVFPGEANWALDLFRGEDWVDALGFEDGRPGDDDTLKWLLSGPLMNEWKKEPKRPLINIVSWNENSEGANGQRVSPGDARRIAWWNLLLVPPAGMAYGADGVADWRTAVDRKPGERDLPLWHKSMFLAGAKRIQLFADFFESIDYWRLQPAPHDIAVQPGGKEPWHAIVASAAEGRELAVVYVPEERTLELTLQALPASPVVHWFNPRTGEKTPAVAVVGGRTCQFPTPDPHDWVLLIKTAK